MEDKKNLAVPPVSKNDRVELTIEDQCETGEGLGKVQGYPLFVKDTVVGDQALVKVIKVKKNYGYGRLESLISPSIHRVEPKCPVAASCGGCQLQALSYQEQLRFKEEKVRNHLFRIGGLKQVSVQPIIGMEEPWHYRNKAQYPVQKGKDGRICMGFYAGRTHSVIETSHCFLGDPVNDRILAVVRHYMEQFHIAPYEEETHSGLVRHVMIRTAKATGQRMVCLIINGKKLPGADKLVQELCEIEGMASISLNCNQEKTNVILGKEIVNLYGEDYILDRIGDIEYQISPQSFYQVNSLQTRVLYQTALEYAELKGDETVWDLYCGIGTISLFLAQKAKQVYGVEIVPAAVENARANAARNGMDNVSFYQGRAEELLPQMHREQGVRADVIVVDPPRKGCGEELLDTILDIKPRRVVYVSCNSATLARDLKILTEGGYQVEKVQPVDMFPQTTGVESVVLLSRTEGTKRANYN